MSKILIADNDGLSREMIKKCAMNGQHIVYMAENGLDILKECERKKPDILIMDVDLPDIDGFSIIPAIRKEYDIPIFIVSKRANTDNRIKGLSLGVDDYMSKPFSTEELYLRIQAILRRYNNGKDSEANHDIFTLGTLQVDFSARTVLLNGERVDMPPRGYALFFYLVKNRNIALSREKLLNEVWGYDYFGDERTLDTHIKLIRSSLGEYKKHIVTLRGIGYKFNTADK